MKEHTCGHLLAAFTILIWGTTFISSKILLKSFTLPSLRQELLFAGAGLCGITLYLLLQNIALTYTLASNVGFIASAGRFFLVSLFCSFQKNKCFGA